MLRDLGKSLSFRTIAFVLTLSPGLDATIFLRCLAMLRWLFLSISIIVGIPALIANYQVNTTYAESAMGQENSTEDITVLDATRLDLLIFTAANASGNTMSAHVIFECLTTCLVVVFGKRRLSDDC